MAEENGERLAEPDGNWRETVRRGLLTAVPWFGPPIALVVILFRTRAHAWVDNAVMALTGILLPLTRLMRHWSSKRRAMITIILGCVTSIYLLGRIGLAAGVAVSLATFSVLALVCASRAAALAIIGAMAAAYFTIGALVSHGIVPLTAVDTDPHKLRNWIRMGSTSTLLSLLLMTIVDFVIRHVEASFNAANQALIHLRQADAERTARERDLGLAYRRLGQLHQKLEATKEEERRALSRELHDELGQTLTALKLRLQMVRAAPGALAGAPQVDPVALVDDLIARVRRISVDLRPPLLDEVGLVSALRVYLDGQAAVSGLTITLAADEAGVQRLPSDLEIVCFRVVQESITNALRHARAARIDVRIARTGNHVSLSVRDDGRGFDPATLDEASSRGHLGVVGMQERVRARDGRFVLTSAPGAGTTVAVELDVRPPERTPS